MTNKQILIKHIPYEIDDDALSNWCSTFGPIVKCDLKRDKHGNSRGFAFITYKTIDGHNKILSQRPHYCRGRPLIMKEIHGQKYTEEYQTNSSPGHLSQITLCSSPTENLNSMTMNDSSNFENSSSDVLGLLRDELEANIECMQIAHEHEIKILREKLERERKLQHEAQESYKEAQEDWRRVNDENTRLRTSLIKNVMQTFNIRRDLARRIKDQLKKCEQIEKQCHSTNSNRMTSNFDETSQIQSHKD